MRSWNCYCIRAIKSLLIIVFLGFGSVASAAILSDGYYVKVSNGVAFEFSYQKMDATKNENCWMSNENLLDAYVFIPAKSLAFSIVSISDGVETSFSPLANFTTVDSLLYYEPTPRPDFLRGQYSLGTKAFGVIESGLYYISVETSSRWITCMPVKKWNVIGTAIPGGWEPKQLVELTPDFSPDNKSAVFSIDSLEMKRGFFQIRFTDGWKITIDSVSDNECWNKGSKVFTAFGGSVDSLVLGGGNILWQTRGIYSVKLFWDSGKSLTSLFTKLKDVPMVDYSQFKMGILGDAYNYSNGKRAFWEFNYGDVSDTSLPIKNGNIYSWYFSNLKLITGGEFKFRQGTDWTGLAVDFQDVSSWSGDAKSDFKNMDSKFHVTNSGEATYNVILQIDALTDAISVVVNKVL